MKMGTCHGQQLLLPLLLPDEGPAPPSPEARRMNDSPSPSRRQARQNRRTVSFDPIVGNYVYESEDRRLNTKTKAAKKDQR